MARVRPFSYSTYLEAPITVDGYTAAPYEVPKVEYNQVGPGYFRTMGIPLVSGREFTRDDDENAAPVVIVNQKMVSQYWRGEDPVGKRLQQAVRADAVRSPARLNVRDDFALDPREIGVHGENNENKDSDLDNRDDQERVLGQKCAHDFASASGKDCIMVQNRPSEPLVKRVSFAERMSCAGTSYGA